MTPVTIILLLLTAITTFITLSDRRWFDRFSFQPEMVLRHNEYERLVTSGFLHVDWTHFAMNAISLYSFGPALEWKYGAATLLLIYFGSVIGGSLLALVMHRNHDYCAVGASGGVCGLIFAVIFLVPGTSISMFLLPIGIPAWLYAIGFLAFSYWGMQTRRDNIGHDAHFGGALAGVMIALGTHPSMVLEQKPLLAAVVCISGILLALTWKNPRVSAGRLFSWQDEPHQSNIRYQRYDEAKLRRKEEAEIDALLEKISKKGLHSLSSRERKRLEGYSLQKREVKEPNQRGRSSAAKPADTPVVEETR